MTTHVFNLRRAATGAALLSLAACGGGGGGAGLTIEPTAQELPPGIEARKSLYDDATERLEARSNTAFIEPFVEGMPTSGEATFKGILYTSLDTGPATTELYGVAELTAVFDPGTIGGSASDFWGSDRDGAEAPYAGTVAFTDGIIGVERPNDFDVDYSGTLSGNGEVVDLSGTLDGDFKADRIRGILAVDGSPIASIDAAPVGGSVNLAAEIER